MNKKNKLDQLSLADLNEADLAVVKQLEEDLNRKYDTNIFLMALERKEEKE